MEKVTPSQFATAVGVHPQVIRDAIYEGMIPAEKRLVAGRNGRHETYLIDEEQIALYRDRHLGKGGGRRYEVDKEESGRMAQAGYLTLTQAGKEIEVSPSYLSRLVKTGRVKGVKKHIMFIHENEVARLKAERERKMAAVR